ncbi:Ribonuclease BN, tRNA processing enzyme [Lentzea albidocapillata subsp. violacea]|uniref:Ribonuclease BN, tRNA processing enzyme n=1 Tax=Lentzea albidocapillata subsp. violacea TaxID=128104 RepID=A0A1G8UUF6_9PSEU|nr:MBL fold metallo-hydrolase [Lentzea albidocapillata]SDJ57187.1 Ribonuclease BN, tRNA processing enzyme [Lentzea albidocapillata subsp. violacea]
MDLSLTVLGCATPYPSTDNPCSGYLVSHGDTRVWMDAGTGTLGPLQRHTRLEDLDAIWISHLHADHSADLLTAYYALLFADVERDPVPLYGPPGIADRLAGFLTNGPVRSPIEDAFEVVELHDGLQAAVGSMWLTTAAVEHGIPAFGVRIEAGGAALTYSGDTAPCPSLTELANGTDVLLCESESTEKAPDMVHHTPEDAGDTAAAAQARRLVITHVGRFLTPQEAVTRASARFSGSVDYAEPGTTVRVG